jgi:hypothetical protein
MDQDEITLTQVGLGLLETSREAEFSARGVLPELFPYIHAAADRMSTRAISRWLQEAHGIKLSAVSIAKALRNPDKYWEAFADQIEPVARAVEAASGVKMEDFLYDQDVFWHEVRGKKTGLVLDCGDSAEEEQHAFLTYEANLDFLDSHWWSMKGSAREGCRPYLLEEKEEISDAK